jgi:hypothetical protein
MSSFLPLGSNSTGLSVDKTIKVSHFYIKSKTKFCNVQVPVITNVPTVPIQNTLQLLITVLVRTVSVLLTSVERHGAVDLNLSMRYEQI